MAQTQVQTQTQAEMDSLPTLATEVLKSPADQQTALKLVADSIAQQRQVASYYLITRPLNLSILFTLYAVVYVLTQSDFPLTLITSSGVTLTYLLLIRLITSDYIRQAEAFRWQSFIQGPNKKNDIVLATRYGEELIGTLVLRLQPSEGKGVIRAWTVLRRYRGKGIGGDLLQMAVDMVKEKCGRDSDVEFAADHANSGELKNSMLGRPFEDRDRRALTALSRVMDNSRGKTEKE